MMISVITPTRNREARLQTMYRCFAAQSWPVRELLILDDSPAPSAFFSAINDRRVIYRHSPTPIGLGEKRNLLAAEARGELIAHFDDDDLYAPDYLARMVALRGDADFFKLSGWHAFVEKTRTFWFWDSAQILPFRYSVSGKGEVLPQQRPPTTDVSEKRVDLDLWGYGFSYLYTRGAWEQAQFPALNFGEDHVFASRIAHAADREGLTLHVLHGANSSRIFPQYALPDFAARRIFGNWLDGLLPPPP